MDAELTRGGTVSLTAVAAYAAMLLGGAALFLLIASYGQGLTAPAPVLPVTPAASTSSVPANTLLHVLLALAAVVVAGRLLSLVLGVMGQPAVIGEILAGILLGPSLLGRVAPGVAAYVLPSSVAPFLNVVAQLGIVVYMFLVGLNLSGDLVRGRAHATVATSHASMVAPFVFGAALALALYPRLSTRDISFTTFALFLGVALSVTAFPVLARILADRGMTRTPLGAAALTCAAADDVTAWCLLAFVVGVAQAEVEHALRVVVLTLGFIAVMFLAIRPVVVRLVARWSGPQSTGRLLSITLVGMLLSALATEQIGVHALFGAFLFGVVVPHDSQAARVLRDKMEDFVTILFLPAFFALTGLRTTVGLLSGVSEWAMCGLIVIVATAGKFGGTFAAARLTGYSWHDAASLGVLMNTRGLMELVVLNVGLDLGVISPKLFAMLVVMAVVTTMATTPALQALGFTRSRRGEPLIPDLQSC